jgi:glycerol-3-phosphate acyltransferase PlsY
VSPHAIRIAFGAAAFLLGSVPFGVFIARAYGVGNIRKEGSGNVGATNVSRVAGFWPAGFLTFLLDALKGILLVAPIRFHWIPEEVVSGSPVFLWTLGLLAVLGHCYSPWLRFNGGKGVATCFGVILLLAPWSGLVGGVVYGLAYLATRVGAIGSLLGLIAAVCVHRIFVPYDPSMLLFAAMVLVAVYRHEPNLDVLLETST